MCDSDSPLTNVDVAIPANNKGKYSIGLLYFLLAREINRLRGVAPRNDEWMGEDGRPVSVDLFFYRDPEEIEKAVEEQEAKRAAAYEEAQAEAQVDEFGNAPAVEQVQGEYVEQNWDAAAPAPGGAADWQGQQPQQAQAAAPGNWNAGEGQQQW